MITVHERELRIVACPEDLQSTFENMLDAPFFVRLSYANVVHLNSISIIRCNAIS